MSKSKSTPSSNGTTVYPTRAVRFCNLIDGEGLFSTTAGLCAKEPLAHASSLLAGVLDFMATEVRADLYNGGDGNTDQQYLLTSVIESIKALVDSVIVDGGAV